MRNNDALTADDVANLLQVSRSTVYKLVKTDELASYHVGRKMRFTMGDVEKYIKRAKRIPATSYAASDLRKPSVYAQTQTYAHANMHTQSAATSVSSLQANREAADTFLLAGNDIIGDILANYLSATGLALERVYEGSYNALVNMYRGQAQAALTHLYDGETKQYNVPSVKSLLPGEPLRVIRLVRRRQGLIVAKGNPKNLRSWEDLLQPGIRLINRERGCGSRILLDEMLIQMNANRTQIAGYDREATSALSMASFVARGAADAGIGAERVFHQVEGVDFLPLQDEWLDIVLLQRLGCERVIDAITHLVRTRPFREEVGSIVGYDAAHMGEIVFEQ